MKKYFTIVTVTVMLIVSGACFAKGKDPDALLYTKGLELIHRMDLIAESKEYTNLFSNSIELKAIVEKIGKVDYSDPKAVYKVTIPKGVATSVFVRDDITKIPEELKVEIEKRLVATISPQINALRGSMVLAAASIVASSDGFIHKKLSDNTLYIYIYEGEYSAIVSFIPGNENIVWAHASFVINDSLNQVSSASQMSEWLKENVSLVDCEIEILNDIN